MRFLALLAALAAVLLMAPAAFAATTYTVDDPGDGSDSDTADLLCDDGTGKCTLRAAIEQSNFTPGADTVEFAATGQSPAPATALPAVTDQLLIDGGGATTVTFGAGATGMLLDLLATDSTVRAITLRGGGSGTVVNAGAARDRLDAVRVPATPGSAMRASGSSVRIDSPVVGTTGADGIAVTGGSVTISSARVTDASWSGISVGASATSITSPEVSGGSGNGIRLGGTGASVSGGHVHGNAGHGIAITGQANSVTKVVLYGNRGRPIFTGPGANGAIVPPQNLRIGPRRPDGSLPLTGTATGRLELWSGDPASTTPPGFFTSFGVGGDFTYNFPSEPPPGAVFSANVDNHGSSEFARVVVPADTRSPEAASARALDTENVRVDATEPLDPASVQKEDFALAMAGADRPIESVTVAPDGRFVTLKSSGWRAGEAGYVQIGGAGAFADSAGNASLTGPRLRVAAAPGDFIAPLGAQLKITPKTICLTRGRRCRRPGMRIRFLTTEAGKATMVVKRSNKTVGRRLYGNIVPGLNKLKFNGRLNARKLRAGRYRLLMYVQDQVGNITDRPPIQLFSVRRTMK